MNKITLYRFKNAKSKTNKVIPITNHVFFDTNMEFYYLCEEEVIRDENNKVTRIGDKEVRYSYQFEEVTGVSLDYGYEDNRLIDIYAFDENDKIVHNRLFFDDKDRVLSVGKYVIVYDNNDYIIDIVEDENKAKEFENKKDLSEFVRRHKSVFDKYNRIAEDVEEELEEIRKAKEDNPRLNDTDYQVEVTNKFIEDNPDVKAEYVEEKKGNK